MSEHVIEHPKAVQRQEKPEGKKEQKEKKSNVIAEQELIAGQPVIVAVRWILIISSLVLAIWNVTSLSDLRLQMVAILILAITNFYLQAQLLMKKPVNKNIIYSASAVDLTLITLLIIFQGGYFSSIYVFYLPAIAAFAVAFPSLQTLLFSAVAIAVYGIICVFTDGQNDAVIITRLVMIAAIAFCGNMYLRIERSRRQELKEQQEQFLKDLKQGNIAG